MKLANRPSKGQGTIKGEWKGQGVHTVNLHGIHHQEATKETGDSLSKSEV
jgi:hypothetical protein